MRLKSALLALTIFGSISGSAFAYDAQIKPFEDVTSEWSKDYIYSLSALGIINGVSDASYQPRGTLTREAFVKLLVASAKLKLTGDSGGNPADVNSDRWSYNYIKVAYQQHWLDFMLDPKGAFYPEQTITREEVAALIGASLLSKQPSEMSRNWSLTEWMKQRDVSNFPDQMKVNEAIRPAVYYTANRGIMEGDFSGFRPKDALTREEAAAVINRLIDSQMAGRSLEVQGFYAVRSYSAINKIPSLNNLIAGWSQLEYSTPGSASLNTTTAEYNIPKGSEEVIGAADAAHIRKDLMVHYNDKNLQDFVKDAPAQEAFIRSLTDVLQDSRYSFTGVCVDFEGLLDDTSAQDYLRFLQKLKAQLGIRTLSVAVPPTFYYKGYNLKGIGETADSVILMAHDFTHDDGHLPSAPLPLVNETVEKALLEIPAQKLILGISKQANQWITANGMTNRYSPDITEVEKRLISPDSMVTWNLPYYLKRIVFQDQRGSHDIYYEDSASIEKKLWLAKFYGLKGVSLWYMGNFTAADWDVIQNHR